MLSDDEITEGTNLETNIKSLVVFAMTVLTTV